MLFQHSQKSCVRNLGRQSLPLPDKSVNEVLESFFLISTNLRQFLVTFNRVFYLFAFPLFSSLGFLSNHLRKNWYVAHSFNTNHTEFLMALGTVQIVLNAVKVDIDFGIRSP